MLCPRLLLVAFAVAVLLSWRPLAVLAGSEMTERARKFVKDHETRLHPLDVAANRAWWDANTSGKAEDFARFFGTPTFLIAQTVIVGLWILVNMAGWTKFDIYPSACCRRFVLPNLASRASGYCSSKTEAS